jgi:hypothetical protein
MGGRRKLHYEQLAKCDQIKSHDVGASKIESESQLLEKDRIQWRMMLKWIHLTVNPLVP